MFNKIFAVVLIVHDFDASLEFYRDTLGLKVINLERKNAQFAMEGTHFILTEITDGEELVGYEMSEPPLRGVNPALMCVRVADVDAAFEALSAKGVEFTREPVNLPWGIRAAYFKDPEGNIWEIAHALPDA